jgi:uncharacterized membrane protein
MKPSFRHEWPALLALAVAIGISIVAWSALPEVVPTHWGLSGRPDAWGSRATLVIFGPILAVGIYALLWFLPRLDPMHHGPPAVVVDATRGLRIGIDLVLRGVQTLVILAGMGRVQNVAPAIMALVGALFVLIGFVLGGIQPNWFIGIRTPWTLSSRKSWDDTHRAARWLFIVNGMLLVVAGLIGSLRWSIALVLINVVAGLGLVAYSYFAWASDPERQPPRTSPLAKG